MSISTWWPAWTDLCALGQLESSAASMFLMAPLSNNMIYSICVSIYHNTLLPKDIWLGTLMRSSTCSFRGSVKYFMKNSKREKFIFRIDYFLKLEPLTILRTPEKNVEEPVVLSVNTASEAVQYVKCMLKA